MPSAGRQFTDAGLNFCVSRASSPSAARVDPCRPRWLADFLSTRCGGNEDSLSWATARRSRRPSRTTAARGSTPR